jgi:hypothetical protein
MQRQLRPAWCGNRADQASALEADLPPVKLKRVAGKTKPAILISPAALSIHARRAAVPGTRPLPWPRQPNRGCGAPGVQRDHLTLGGQMRAIA